MFPLFASRIAARFKELSTTKASAERLSLTTIPLEAADGKLVRQSSRPLAPSIALTLIPDNTTRLSSPDRERSKSSADELEVLTGSSLPRPVLHKPPPLYAS